MLNRLTLDGRDYSLVKLPDGFKIGDRPYVMLMGGQVFIMEAVSDETDLKKQERPDEKIEKKIIFKTNDGVEYFDEQAMKGVSGVNTTNWDTTGTTIVFARKDYAKDWIFFSTELEREKFITENKPTLSLNEVLNWAKESIIPVHPIYKRNLIDLVESKL